MTSPSGVPAPQPGDGVKPAIPAPGPAIVPPKHHRPKRRTALWGMAVVAVLLAGGVELYLKSNADSKLSSGGAGFMVPTLAVSLGDLNATIRVNGTVSAQNFAALTAPRILGSRSALNRGGDGGFNGGGGGQGGGGGGGGFQGGGGMGGPGGPGGPGGDFNLVLLHLAKPGSRVKAGEVVAEFDPQFQIQRLDDYKDTVIQQENNIRKSLANLASLKEAHDQQVRSAKADRERSLLDLKTDR